MIVNSIAEGYGHITLSNSIIELETGSTGPCLALIGSSEKVGKRMGIISNFQCVNTTFGGSNCLDLKNVQAAQFTNCLIWGSQTGIRFLARGSVIQSVFSNINFQVSGEAMICEDTTPIIDQVAFENCYYQAHFHSLLHFATADGKVLPAGQVSNITVHGGIIGSGAPSVNLPRGRGGKFILVNSTKADGSRFNSGPLKKPAMPESGRDYQNAFLVDCDVYVAGGAVSAIAVNGVRTGLTAGTIHVPSGASISLTYSAAPTWEWFGR